MLLSVLTRTAEDVAAVQRIVEGQELALQIEFSAAPQSLNYSFPFPVLVVTEGDFRGRYFGKQALNVLAEMIAGQEKAA